ncbi:MAG: S9 family peptidase [Chloroflexia bacterium]|nr:S9 family peptidase [Chloroflexia bacterium]
MSELDNASAPIAGAGADARTITADDLFRINLVGDPRTSPDGMQIAYVVTLLDRDADDYRSAIWLVHPLDGEPRQLTSGVARDNSPCWSPDGALIAFSSNRPGNPPEKSASDDETAANAKKKSNDDKPLNQIWIISVGGGEARQVTRQEHGASAPTWSPDGRTISFLAATDPPEDEHTKPIADERIIERMQYRHDGSGFVERAQQLWTVPVEGGAARQLTKGDMDITQPAWAPDGRHIVFVSNRCADRDTNHFSALHRIPAAGGEVQLLTEENVGFNSPVFSPDGTRLAFVGITDPDPGGGKNNHLWTMPASGGESTDHTAGWDRSIGDEGMSDLFTGADQRPVWTADGTSIIVLSSDHGATHAHWVPLETGNVSAVTAGPRRIAGIALAGEDNLVTLAGTPSEPFELFTVDLVTGQELQRTNHNRALLDEVELSGAEELRYLSPDGAYELQGWLLHPPGYRPGAGVKYPLILEVHGGPHAMYGYAMFHEMQLLAAKGYVVLFTNPRGSSGYGESFTTSTRGHWGESDMPDIIAGLDAVLDRDEIDPNRIGVTGGSYGGFMTNWIIGHTDRFRAAVTQRCVSNFHSFYGTSDIGFTFGEFEFGGTPWADAEKLLAFSPISYVEQMHTPLLIIHNEQDLRCPIEQAEQLFISLKRLGREVAFVRIPNEDHNLSRTGKPSRRLARLHHLIGWFDAHL